MPGVVENQQIACPRLLQLRSKRSVDSLLRRVLVLQVVYLKDKDATQEGIDAAFAAQLKKPRAGDLLVLYYAGHGYKSEARDDTFLASYDTDGDKVSGLSV